VQRKAAPVLRKVVPVLRKAEPVPRKAARVPLKAGPAQRRAEPVQRRAVRASRKASTRQRFALHNKLARPRTSKPPVLYRRFSFAGNFRSRSSAGLIKELSCATGCCACC
jgi:hypothetical protein